jgi:hypothetical protein
MSIRIISVTLLSAALLSSCSSPSDDRQGQCHPCTVSPKVGPLLKEAQQMIAAKNYDGATAQLKEAEAVKVTADDAYVIDLFKNVIVASVSDPTPTPIITPQFPQP